MFEKLVKGDRVLKIPAPKDIIEGTAVPYGASGIVVKNEDYFPCWSDEGIEEKYGCVILYDNKINACPHTDDGTWFRVREGLMKISPDESLKDDEISKPYLPNYEVEIKRINGKLFCTNKI